MALAYIENKNMLRRICWRKFFKQTTLRAKPTCFPPSPVSIGRWYYQRPFRPVKKNILKPYTFKRKV